MVNPSPLAVSMFTTALDIESAFYDALGRADAQALMALWADDEEIVCVHPGGPRLVGTAAVRAAFEAVFNNGPVQVHPENVRRVHALSAAMHSVI